MTSEKRGVTVVTALMMVVVLSILTSTIVLSTKLIMENVYKKEFKTEYYLVKSAVEDYITRNSGIIDFEEIDIDLSNIPNNYLNQFSGQTIVENKIEAYVVNLEKVGVDNATYGNKLNSDLDIYVVTKATGDVYYMKGFETNNFIYYKVIED